MLKDNLYSAVIAAIMVGGITLFLIHKPNPTNSLADLQKNAVIFTEQDFLKQEDLDEKVSNFLEYYYTTKNSSYLIQGNPDLFVVCAAKTVGYLPKTKALAEFTITKDLSSGSLFPNRIGYSGNIFAFYICGQKSRKVDQNDLFIFTREEDYNYATIPTSLYYNGDITSTYSILQKRLANSYSMFQTCEDFMNNYQRKSGYPDYCDTYFPPPFLNIMKQGLSENEVKILEEKLASKTSL